MKKVKKFIIGQKKLIIICLVIFLGIFIGYQQFFSKKNKVGYETSTVEKGTIVSSVSASGQVLSVNVMSASTKASGIVAEVFVKDGDVVQKGDKILEIALDLQGEQKYSQAWSSYLSAVNSLDSAKATQYTLQADMLSKWDSYKVLAESDKYKDTSSPNRSLPEFYISQDNWLASEAKYKIQESTISQAQASLNSAWLSYQQTMPIITAPTDGVITSLMYSPGMSIGSLDTGSTESNQKVATIKTEGMPIISVNLSEIDVSQVELGQKTIITLDSFSDKTFSGVVVGVDRIGQTSSGVTQYPAIIKLDSASAQILPNMTATAKIIIQRKDNALLIPVGAVETQNDQSYVSVLNKGKTERISIETGLVSDNQIEVISGLKEGDLIITNTISSSDNSQDSTSPFSSNRGINQMMRMGR